MRLSSRLRRPPRIEQLHAGRLKIRNIPCDERHMMDKRRGRDQAVSEGDGIRHMENGATPRHGGIDGQNTSGERWKHLILKPSSKDSALRRIPPFRQQDANLKFLHGDRRQIQRRRFHSLSPERDVSVRPSKAYFSQFGNNIGVQEKHYAKSAARARSLESAGISKSASAGIASKSAIFF